MSVGGDILAPQAGVKAYVPPWEVMAWKDDQLKEMYKDWGIYYVHRRRLNAAKDCFNKALNIYPNDVNILRRRSQAMRMQALAPTALISAQKAQGILRTQDPRAFDVRLELEICDGFYESNRLEDAKRALHDDLRLTSDTQSKPVLNLLSVVTSNIEDALSDEAAPAINRLINDMIVSEPKKPKPQLEECDVLSVEEKQREFLSPLEMQRRRREFMIYNQNYLDRSWADVSFLANIRSEPNLFLKQISKNSPYLENLTSSQYKAVRTFTKMLHTRYPKYCHDIDKYPNQELKAKHQKDYIFRLQYQTRRNMCQILRNIKNLIKNKELSKLTTYVEDVMGNYVTIKTNRIMPWKFEFINEVYNYLGLARINEYKAPGDMKVLTGRHRLLILFKLPQKLVSSSQSNEVKDMNIKRISMEDPKAELLKKATERYEYRLRFAKYSIERSYLLHELAQAHLTSNSFDKCCVLAKKSTEEALRGRHYFWAALSTLLACKVYVILGKLEKLKDVLKLVLIISKKLRNIDLSLFVDVCHHVVSEELNFKKSLILSDISLKKKPPNSENSRNTSSDSLVDFMVE